MIRTNTVKADLTSSLLKSTRVLSFEKYPGTFSGVIDFLIDFLQNDHEIAGYNNLI